MSAGAPPLTLFLGEQSTTNAVAAGGIMDAIMLSGMDDDGEPVDWWFAYELPHDAVVVPGATK